ncbi:iron-containing alcohol dehydrogenase [Spirochaeta isovalerica]|uniref:Alcohol dehydrogenase n=1 Tax=Spirochaeta isovalerica TaxID=150 RepID=A0A841RHV4_9SPIO|nr:iron-containing alcohol dehydrogenase [Spirochaeta isovalerica]MBB6482590.1 alcohol dehydrogenase [Spirochaeta isovalerica]
MAEIRLEFPGSLIFGNKEILRLGSEASSWGERVLLISDSVHKSTGTLDYVKGILEKKHLKVLVYSDVKSSASTFSIEEAVSLAERSHSQVIVGLGGVRTLSFAKAVAFVAAGEGNIDDFFTDRVTRRIVLPFISVPTSLRDPFLLSESCFITESRQRTSSISHLPPFSTKQIIVDPTLTVSLPAKYSLLALMEILLSSIEAYISRQSSFLVETAALDAIGKVTSVLDKISGNQGDLNFRKIACEASVSSAMALSMTGPLPGLMLAYVTGSYYKVPRVSLVTTLYPHVFDSSIYSSTDRAGQAAKALREGLGWSSLGERDSLSTMVRSIIARYKLPVRLEEMKIKSDELSICSDITSALLSNVNQTVGADSLFEILRESF